MKKILHLLLTVSILSTGYCQTEKTVTLDVSKDAQLISLYPDREGDFAVDYASFELLEWTKDGTTFTTTGVMDFDFSVIHEDAEIIRADLKLYYNPQSGNVPYMGGHSSLSGSNAGWIWRTTSAWEESSVTYNNDPSYSTVTAVEIPQSTSADQDYVINVTPLVQDIFENPDNSFGFTMKIQVQQHYRAFLFASSDHPNLDLRPKLIVTYVDVTASPDHIAKGRLSLYPNPVSGGILQFSESVESSQYSILNAQGSVIKTGDIEGNQLNIEELQAGIYHLVLGSTRSHFVVEE